MSEKQRPLEQHHGKTEQLSPHSHEKNIGKELNERASEHKENSHERALDARKTIEQVAVSKELSSIASEQSQKDTTEVRWWSSELKAQTLDRTLASVRRRLSPSERKFSRVIHQKTVEDVSEIAGKTIARPSGVLIGSFLAFIGSLVAYLVSRRIGGELSPSVTLVFFVGGFVIGIAGEAIVYALRKMRARRIGKSTS